MSAVTFMVHCTSQKNRFIGWYDWYRVLACIVIQQNLNSLFSKAIYFSTYFKECWMHTFYQSYIQSLLYSHFTQPLYESMTCNFFSTVDCRKASFQRELYTTPFLAPSRRVTYNLHTNLLCRLFLKG